MQKQSANTFENLENWLRGERKKMKPTREAVKKYWEKEGLNEKDLSAVDLVNLYDHGTVDSLSGVIIIPVELHDKLEIQATRRGVSVDQEANRLLEKCLVHKS